MKILSRNVNGIRAVVKKWFIQTINNLKPDIICLQETKAFFDQCPQEVLDMWYQVCWHAGTRPWYAGTAIFTKNINHVACNTFDHEMFHEDGRVTEISFGNTILINGYFPNGWERADGREMLTYKLAFYDKLMAHIKPYQEAKKNIIIVWDYNICHNEIDIARPKENKNSIGFLPIEREKISEFLSQGFVDVFRYLYPDTKDSYTWWSYRAGAKPNNVGRRIDYACVSDYCSSNIIWFSHYPDIGGSDHCPIMLEIDIK